MSLGFWLYAVGAALWTACAVAYLAREPWWRSWIGRSLVGSWSSFAAVLILAAIFRVEPLPHAVLVTLAAVDVAGLVQLATVLHLQRRDRAGR